MDKFLASRKPIVLQQSIEPFNETTFLHDRKPIVIQEMYDSDSNGKRFSCVTSFPPTQIVHTDLPDGYVGTFIREGYIDDSSKNSHSRNIIIPPLNTDIRFTDILPKHDISLVGSAEFVQQHPHNPHTHERYDENFSWHLPSSSDNEIISAKKKRIHPVQNQHMCGSCWAMSTSAAMSDCLVIGNAVTWAPKISPTFIMMCIPKSDGNGQCDGGNPASVVLYLEKNSVSDTSCIDYSWCANDKKLCTSASAAQHFTGNLGAELNKQIPSPCGCYFSGDKYAYKLDSGSNVFHVSDSISIDLFRNSVKAHLIDFGPPIGGYTVLKNFITGNFTDPSINEGVYFDRCNYFEHLVPGRQLKFSDSFASVSQLVGLHAVCIVGWGLAKNVQYNETSRGNVPFWWCRNSWGPSWGNMKGYFKIAMYPFNKFSQFDAQISLQNSKFGGVVLARATQKPSIRKMNEISSRFQREIVKSQPDSYYKQHPSEMTREGGDQIPDEIFIIVGVVVIIAIIIYVKKRD